jgi:hypothetical protein
MQQQVTCCVRSRVLASVRPSSRRLLRVSNSINSELTSSTKCRVKVSAGVFKSIAASAVLQSTACTYKPHPCLQHC